MVEPEACPRCRFPNDSTRRFCEVCGAPLASAVVAAGPPAARVRAPLTVRFSLPLRGIRHERQSRDTKAGALFLALGALLAWIPLVSILGAILTLIGMFLLLSGRTAFGPAHARNVTEAIAVFVGSIIVFAMLSLVAFVGFARGVPSAESVAQILPTYLLGIGIVAIVSNLSSFLITYALQGPVGRAILWGGWATFCLVEASILLFVALSIQDALRQAFAGPTFDPDPIDAITAAVGQLGLLAIIPSLLFATAYFMAWARVRRWELMERSAAVSPAQEGLLS